MVRDPRSELSGASRPPIARLIGRGIAWMRQPLPPPPDTLRRGPLAAGAFPSELRSTRLTSQLGIALGAAFTICFITGLISHFIQHPPGWFWWPSRPVGLYRVTQGLHVATGLASVPLLGAKLWSVYHRLFRWPPVLSLAHAIERASIAVLVAGALFQMFSGILNIARWYAPMPFFFTSGHYQVAWLTVGALLVHIGVQLPVVRIALTRDRLEHAPEDALSRRGLLGAVAAAAGVITLATVGQTVAPVASLSVLAPRRPDVGPQGLPVNKTSAAAGVRDRALDPAYRLVVVGPARQLTLSIADLLALPQHSAVLPIACVEGWSATGTWGGVRLRDLVALVGADPDDAWSQVESLQGGGKYRTSTVPPPHTQDPLTLIALRLGGQPLHLDHGFPARLIAPNRPGVMQTKWIARITVRSGP